jgi:formylglycine-generating enzyme required for sulfatase activity
MFDFMHFSDENRRESLAPRVKWIGGLSLLLLSASVIGAAKKETKTPKTVVPRKATAAATKTPAPKLKTYSESIPDSLVKFQMVQVPGGTLDYTDSKGAKSKVTIKPFWIEKTEMTWDVFDIFAYGFDLTGSDAATAAAISRPSRPYGPPDRGFGHQGYPVISETYYAAEQFCEWLSLKTKKKYRLPTEQEWEYACRAGAAAKPLDPKTSGKIAWSSENSENKSHPVAQKAPSPWALYDMLGNVMEWCKGDADKPVARGGSWKQTAGQISCAARFYQDPSWNSTDPQFPKSKWWLSDGNFIGFRVVRDE